MDETMTKAERDRIHNLIREWRELVEDPSLARLDPDGYQAYLDCARELVKIVGEPPLREYDDEPETTR